MKNKKDKKRVGLVEKVKRAINLLVAEDIRTEGKVTSFIIAAMCFLGIILVAIICVLIKLG